MNNHRLRRWLCFVLLKEKMQEEMIDCGLDGQSGLGIFK